MEETGAPVIYEGFELPWWAVVLEGIAALVIGILLLTSPGITMVVIVQFLGILWLFGGVLALIGAVSIRENRGWNILSAVLGILAGIVILLYPVYAPFVLLAFLIIVLGIWGIIYGITRLVWAMRGGGVGTGILGLLSLVFGVILLINPLIGAVTLPFVFGAFAVVGGILAIIAGIRAR
ncbi:MAG: HdeD family acid-resistance protein [Methanofollis sp.]|nr:HdeD family acid-resistance protein [Methanofollis sp.]